jgi:hypothetical protein
VPSFDGIPALELSRHGRQHASRRAGARATLTGPVARIFDHDFLVWDVLGERRRVGSVTFVVRFPLLLSLSLFLALSPPYLKVFLSFFVINTMSGKKRSSPGADVEKDPLEDINISDETYEALEEVEKDLGKIDLILGTYA